MYDIIFLAVPYGIIAIPPLGISVLSGVVKYHGFKSKCFDLSMELSKRCIEVDQDFEAVQSTLLAPGPELDPIIKKLIDDTVDRLITLNPKFVGISVFSYFAHYFTYHLSIEIKKRSNLKIVIGGPGVGTTTTDELYTSLNMTSLEKMLKFGEVLKKRNLVDYVIVGDGEQAVLDLLTEGNNDFTKYQIFNYKQEFPFSNFDDFDFSEYKGQLNKGYPQIPFFTSKGCVKNCDFCDVNIVQQRFRFRHGKNIVKELIYLADKYNIRDFNFTDSLVNGSLKSLTDWTTELAEYNKNNPDKKITWTGMWANRPIGQVKDKTYQLLAESGCKTLSIGVETGSDNVLTAMLKKTTIEALFYEIKKLEKYNVPFITLLIVGHWAEKWEDFVQTLQMLYKLGDYVKTGHYVAAGIGNTLSIIKDSPMDRDPSNKIQYENPNLWWTEVNPALTLKERYYRLLIIEKFCKHFNIPTMDRVLPYAYKTLQKDLEASNNFYPKKIAALQEKPKQWAEHYFQNFELLVNNIVDSNTSDDFLLELEVESSAVNSDPGLAISFNDQLLYNDLIKEGAPVVIAVKATQDNVNSLKIKLTNKGPNDTLVDKNGNITKDKFVLIKNFKINGVNLADDIDFYFKNIIYKENDTLVEPKLGFWLHNSQLEVNFNGLFKPWYLHTSGKNGVLDANIITEKTIQTDKDDNYYREKIIDLLRFLEV